MVKKYRSQELDAVYGALANSTRRKILARLVNEPCSVGELAEPFDMSLAAVSKHIRILEKAGLVEKERRATTIICRARMAPVASAAAFVHFLEQYIVENRPLEVIDTGF